MQRVLIVDDDNDVRESLVDELCGDYEVRAAGGGREALDLLASGRFDAVISDLRMPDVGGIQVLDRAVQLQPEIVRILLTGFLDEEAHRATILEGAPYKIGKPWHDEIDVTLRRAFEQREIRRRLASSIESALEIGKIDEEYASHPGLVGIARVLSRHAREVRGAEALMIYVDVEGTRRPIAEFSDGPRVLDGVEWELDEPLTGDGSTRVHAHGRSGSARAMVMALVESARHWTSDDMATSLARRAAFDPEARTRLMELTRRAELGAVSGSLVHELATTINLLHTSVGEMSDIIRSTIPLDRNITECLEDARTASQRMISLFHSIRAFLHSGPSTKRRCRLSETVQAAATLAGAHRALRTRLRIAEVDDVEVEIAEPLMIQVLVNLLRNASDALPAQGTVDVVSRVTDDQVAISVTDDGPGLTDDQRDHLFQPFYTTKRSGTGLGMAFCADVLKRFGGTIGYQRAEGRGACFTVTLPRVRK